MVILENGGRSTLGFQGTVPDGTERECEVVGSEGFPVDKKWWLCCGEVSGTNGATANEDATRFFDALSMLECWNSGC